MIVYFLLIILAGTVSGDENDNSDTEYIKTLPASVKKGLLDKVARRILNEVPEVNSGADDINGDALAEKLEAQSEFVKKILKQEVESLKTKRRYFHKLKKFRKSGNNNHQLSGMADSENLDKNDTLFSDTDAKITASDKIDADVGHIDLTLRSGRSKRGDSGINDNDNSTEHGTTENKHENHDREFVPVAIKLDSENEDSEPIKDSNGNITEVLKEEEASDDDIQIRNTKQSEDKIIEIVKETPDVITENDANINKTTTQSGLDTKTTLKNEDTTIKIHFGRKSEDLDLNEIQILANTATVEVSTISNSLSTSSNDTKSPEDTTTPNAINTTAVDIKVSSSETEDDEKHKTDSLFKYSSESYLENPDIDNKARKNLNVLDSKKTSTQKIEEAIVKSEPHLNNTSIHVTEEPLKHLSGITTLIITEAPYVATTTENQPSISISTEIDSNTGTDLQKEPINLETTQKTSTDENILIASDTTTATNVNNATSNVQVSNSSKVVDAKYIKTNDKKPCNETSSKLGVITECDKKRNKTENTTTEINSVNKAEETDKESKVKSMVKAEVKYSLRTIKKKPLYDSLLHFGDMQIKNEYEVHEVDSGKPAFVSQNEKDNNEKNGIEQPRYAPVYNYDPKNAYFNAYNRLGPNEHDKDDDSESSEPGNENIFRTKNIRMSKYIREHQKKADGTDTTKPYFSKEASCEDSESKETKEKKIEVFVLPESHEIGHYPYTNNINYLSHVRQNYFKNQEFGYVPTQEEKDKKYSSVAKYLYNNVVSSNTGEILKNETEKNNLRVNDDDKYIERDDSSEDNSNTGEDTKDKKQIEVVVLDMNENKSTELRPGAYFSLRYKWDKEGNHFTNEARSREDDLDLYVRILKDMVKMDNGALEEYDWLGTTVSVQSAIAKLRSITDQKKSGHRIHPYDSQLFKYVKELYTKASEITKEKEGETLDEHIADSKEDRKVSNNERMALPKTHRKIKNPWKVLMQISDLMYKKVLRNKVAQRTKKFEVFLDCLQQCLDDFHTAIKELTKITKYNNQRWYKNIKELYLDAGTDKEYLEVLLHLYSARLFTLIEESAKNGAEVDYRMYMKENRIEVDRAEVEMMFIIRILKTIHDIRVN